MSNPKVRVLLVEDDEDDYFLTRDLLAEVPGDPFTLEWVATYDAALTGMGANRHDIYLLDYRLNGRTGVDLLRAARAAGCQGPIILLTSQDGRETDEQALQAGAADYLVKGCLDAVLLERSIRYALERHRSALALRQVHEELEARVGQRTAELSRANAQLAEADRRKDEFLAMLAHELRNPLAPVRNGLEILRLAQADPGRREQARVMVERQVRHLSRLVDDLLDVSRFARGKVRLQQERLDLAQLVRTTLEDRRATIEQGGLVLTAELLPRPLWVNGDATRLAQALTNLLENAVKFTDRGGTITVRLGEQASPPRAVLSVCDSGVGIEPAVLPHLFDVFAQADRSLERSRGGLGLGLALVKGLVELHGGTVEAASAGPGRGARFTICLPLLPEAKALAPQSAFPQPTSKPLRILIVEDHSDAANSLRTLLELTGHKVEVANTGPDGVKAATAWKPDVVLCDIGLPGLDGYGVAQALRSSQATARTRLIALTGYGQDEDKRRARQAGFDHHLTKPVPPEELQLLLGRQKL